MDTNNWLGRGKGVLKGQRGKGADHIKKCNTC